MKRLSDAKRLKDLETMAVLAAAFLVLYLMFGTRFLLYASLALLVTGLFLKRLAARISDFWLTFSLAVGHFNNRVILAVVFFVFLTPLALFYRLFAKDPLMLNKDESTDSYFRERSRPFTKADFEKMW